MTVTALVRIILLAAGLALAAATAGAAGTPQKTIGHKAKAAPVTTLGVINADGATLEGQKLTLTGVSGNVVLFTDRPVRAAGQQATGQFIAQWGEGPNSFAKDPPNATVSVLGGETAGVADAVVVLKNPKLDGSTLVFDVDVLEGSLNGAKGVAAVFVDGRGGGGGFGGGGDGGGGWHGDGGGGDWHNDNNNWHDDNWHDDGYNAWYSAPVGDGWGSFDDAAPALCGYYPEPPCY